LFNKMSMRPNFSIACFRGLVGARLVGARLVGGDFAFATAFFASRPESPVPQMLFYYQPSQVYFPRRLVEREGVNP
jgi:hypothetical protein